MSQIVKTYYTKMFRFVLHIAMIHLEEDFSGCCFYSEWLSLTFSRRFCADAVHVGCFVGTVGDVALLSFCPFLGTEISKARTTLT